MGHRLKALEVFHLPTAIRNPPEPSLVLHQAADLPQRLDHRHLLDPSLLQGLERKLRMARN